MKRWRWVAAALLAVSVYALGLLSGVHLGAAATKSLTAACILWDPAGRYNVTIQESEAHPWACAAARKAGFQNQGPAAGSVTCDMVEKGVHVVLRTPAAIDYVPCADASDFWTAITVGLT